MARRLIRSAGRRQTNARRSSGTGPLRGPRRIAGHSPCSGNSGRRCGSRRRGLRRPRRSAGTAGSGRLWWELVSPPPHATTAATNGPLSPPNVLRDRGVTPMPGFRPCQLNFTVQCADTIYHINGIYHHDTRRLLFEPLLSLACYYCLVCFTSFLPLGAPSFNRLQPSNKNVLTDNRDGTSDNLSNFVAIGVSQIPRFRLVDAVSRTPVQAGILNNWTTNDLVSAVRAGILCLARTCFPDQAIRRVRDFA